MTSAQIFGDPVYTASGRRSHFLPHGKSPNDTCSVAICGLGVWPQLWRGTGSQTERDKARSLPICSRCAVITKRRLEEIKLRAAVIAKKSSTITRSNN